MLSVWPFIKLSRPHFLVGGMLMFALGAAAAGRRVDPFTYVLGQLMVSTAQVTAHFVNEYADVEPDRAVTRRTLFSGGSGVLVGGLLRPIVALRAAWVASGLAFFAAIAMAFVSVPAAVLGVAALAISWSYSMPPLRLLGSGCGEVAASIVVAGIVPLIGSLSQGAGVSKALWWSIAIVFLLHVAMMLAFELPDVETDALAGKRVLAVRIGRTGTRVVIVLLLVAGFTAAWGLGDSEAARVSLAGLFGLVPATVMLIAMLRDRAGLLTASAVATLVLTAAGLLAGFLQ